MPSDSADAEPADGDDGGDIKRQIYNVMDSGKVRDRVLSLTDSDLKASIIEAGASQKEQDLCKAILTSAIPSSHNYLYDEEDHPVKIYSSLGNELLPTDGHAKTDLLDDLDKLDLDKDFGGNLSKVYSKVN